jgi:hypothetical protein
MLGGPRPGQDDKEREMTLLETLSSQLPCRYYVGVDIGYKEHVAVAISLQTFVRGDERWKRARCVHFASTQA